MGRRSAHRPEELRELILRAAQEIIEEEGLAGLSARTVAKRIGYSPGTLYNVFENLDDLVLHVEARLLDALALRLQEVERGGTPKETLRRLARAYLAFTHQNPRLWNLLFEHHMPKSAIIPAWYQSKLEGLLVRVEDAMRPLLADADPAAVKRAARVLWAGVHGITSLSTADKLSTVTADSTGQLVDDLVSTYLSGLARPQHALAS
jgi:AcrR family transcriptional regulator